MKQMIKQLALLIGVLGGALVLAATPVGMAHDNSGDTSGEGSGGSSHGSGKIADTTTTGSTEIQTETETETDTQTATDSDSGDDSSPLKTRADKLLKTKREKGKEHTKTQREQACTARKNGIQKRTAAFGTAAQRHLDKLNDAFTKVQAFQTSNQLDVANYDALVAAATAKQAAATTAVDALKALDVQIDCTQTDPAAAVASIKTAASDTKTALKAYRTAIKAVIAALKDAAPAKDDSTSEGGNN